MNGKQNGNYYLGFRVWDLEGMCLGCGAERGKHQKPTAGWLDMHNHVF